MTVHSNKKYRLSQIKSVPHPNEHKPSYSHPMVKVGEEVKENKSSINFYSVHSIRLIIIVFPVTC